MEARDYLRYIEKHETGYRLTADTPESFKDQITCMFEEFEILSYDPQAYWIWETLVHTLSIPLIDCEKNYAVERENIREFILNHEWQDVDLEQLMEFLRLPYAVRFCGDVLHKADTTNIISVLRKGCELAHFEIADWVAALICKDCDFKPFDEQKEEE